MDLKYIFVFYTFVIVSVFCQIGNGEKNLYEHYTLMQIMPLNKWQMDVVKDFNDPTNQVEILKRSHGLNDTMDILVPHNQREYVKNFADENGLDLQIKEENYGSAFPDLGAQIARRFYRGFEVFSYNSYDSIIEHLDMMAKRRPDLIQVLNAGNSYQDRRIKMVKISTNPFGNNPVIFIDAGIHAREWVAPAMALYLIDRLVMDPESKNNELNGVDWYILPVVNPDGYEYTRTSINNRLWRKTRSKTKFFNCYGVDGNRNYGYKWGVSGVSNNPCDRETYAGPFPFSEPETRAVKNVMLENARRIKLYVSLHAYGQYIVYPWGYTANEMPSTYKKLDGLARKVSSAVARAGGRPFRVMSAGQWYPAAGGSDDFAFGAAGIPYSYTMELTDKYEFQFPESKLQTVLPQFYEGFKVFAEQIRTEFRPSY